MATPYSRLLNTNGPREAKVDQFGLRFLQKVDFHMDSGKDFFSGLKFTFLGVKSGHFYGLCHFAGIEGCLPELRAVVKEF